MEEEEKKYELTKEQMDQIAYFLDDWMRLTGFGGEYNKMVMLAKSIHHLTGYDFKGYYYPNKVCK